MNLFKGVVSELPESVNSSQQRLLRHLFKDYDKDGHPGNGSTVKVTFSARLVRIVDIVSNTWYQIMYT